MSETPAPAGRRKWFAFAALGIVWGSTWVATETLGESVPPLLGAAARFLLAAVLLIPLILWKRLKLPPRRTLIYIFLLSVTMIALPFVLLLWAGQQLSSATVAVLFAAMPLLVALLTPILGGGTVAPGALQAASVGLGAIVLAVGASFSAAQAWGSAVALVGVAFIGASSLIARRELGSVHPSQ
jgi:drug/metabolite transporter (DMT)-like permease